MLGYNRITPIYPYMISCMIIIVKLYIYDLLTTYDWNCTPVLWGKMTEIVAPWQSWDAVKTINSNNLTLASTTNNILH